jgi:CheY-like chemotaxis protein
MAKILVADDSRFQVQLLSSYLTANGHKVTTAMDALQASMTALRELPDAIVLDINMPGGTGFEVLKRLRNSTKTCHIPVVIVTGNEMDPDNAKKIGAAGFLHKPVDADALCATVNQVLSPAKPGRS